MDRQDALEAGPGRPARDLDDSYATRCAAAAVRPAAYMCPEVTKAHFLFAQVGGEVLGLEVKARAGTNWSLLV
jgi:hypothetical protein